AVEAPRRQLVDVVVLQLGVLGAQRVELAVLIPHVPHPSSAGNQAIAADWSILRSPTQPPPRTGCSRELPLHPIVFHVPDTCQASRCRKTYSTNMAAWTISFKFAPSWGVWL